MSPESGAQAVDEHSPGEQDGGVHGIGLSHAAVLAQLHEAIFPHDPWSQAAFTTLLASPGVFGYVSLQGFVVARLVADEAEILTIGVLPAARRSGQGGDLLARALAHAARQGGARMFLEVSVDNQPARAFYARRGFAQVGLRRGYYADGADALVLEKTLVPINPDAATTG